MQGPAGKRRGSRRKDDVREVAGGLIMKGLVEFESLAFSVTAVGSHRGLCALGYCDLSCNVMG